MSLIRFKNILFKTVLFRNSRRLKLLFGLVLLSLPCAALAYGANTQSDSSSFLNLLPIPASILDFEFSKISILYMLSAFVTLLAGISFFKATIAKFGSTQYLTNVGLGLLQIGLALSVVTLNLIAVSERQIVSVETRDSSSGPPILQGASCGTIVPEGATIVTVVEVRPEKVSSKAQLLRQATWSEVR